MDYHIETTKDVDDIYIQIGDTLVKMIQIEEGKFNGRIPKPTLGNPVHLTYNLLGYGKAGGTTQYNIADVMVVKNGRVPIIVNTPHEISSVVITVPSDVKSLLGIPSMICLHPFNNKSLRSKYNIHELLAKGIDPQAKNWIGIVNVKLNEWARDPQNIKKTRSVTIHCYSTGAQKKVTVSV